jgi:hypothetical protein
MSIQKEDDVMREWMRNNGKFSSLSLTHSFATIIADGKHKHFIKITTKTRGKSSQSNQEEEEKSFIIFMLKSSWRWEWDWDWVGKETDWLIQRSQQHHPKREKEKK